MFIIYDVISHAKPNGHKASRRVLSAVGNHIPANTPEENALYYNEVYEELNKR